MTRNPASDDDFWKIALHNDTERIDMEDDDNDAYGNDDESSYTVVRHHNERNMMYALNIPPYGCIHLNLFPLSISVDNNDDNVMIPLGAEAWYGSALLAAMFMDIVCSDTSAFDTTMTTSNIDGTTSILQKFLSNHVQRGSYNVNILELGSGAVGLASVVAGLSVTGYLHQHEPERIGTTFIHDFNHSLISNMECRVTLTDSEPHVLQQLEYNINITTQKLCSQYSNQFAIPEFVVRHLDWENINEFQNSYTSSGDNRNALHLVIGSELVYNVQTARSCAGTVLQLLQTNPNVLVMIVNNMNRVGWETTFLSTMDQTPGIRYELEALNSHLHDLASNLVRPGGTLNPFSDFCACYIWKEQHPCSLQVVPQMNFYNSGSNQ